MRPAARLFYFHLFTNQGMYKKYKLKHSEAQQQVALRQLYQGPVQATRSALSGSHVPCGTYSKITILLYRFTLDTVLRSRKHNDSSAAWWRNFQVRALLRRKLKKNHLRSTMSHKNLNKLDQLREQGQGVKLEILSEVDSRIIIISDFATMYL